MNRVAAIFIVVLSLAARSSIAQPSERFLHALWLTETDGRLTPPDGDHGKSIGPFQIKKRYWIDACKQDPSLAAQGYQACRQYDYAKRVVVAYLVKYAGTSASPEAYARTHNGGPSGATSSSTLRYFRRFSERYNAAGDDRHKETNHGRRSKQGNGKRGAGRAQARQPAGGG